MHGDTLRGDTGRTDATRRGNRARTAQPGRAGGGAALLALAVLAAGCGGSSGSSGAREPSGWNVLFLVVDTLRADHLGMYGYEVPTSPALDALAARGVVFERMYSQAPWTKPSVASILTSLYPPQHRVLKEGTKNQLSRSLTTMVEVLSDAGYRTAAVSENPHVQANTGFDQGFDRFEKGKVYGGRPQHVVELAKEIIDGSTGSGADGSRDDAHDDAPFFLYLHFLDPHGPYTPKGEHVAGFLAGKQTDQPRILEGTVGKMLDGERLIQEFDEGDLEYFTALYDAEIREVDEAIAELVAHLEARGRFEDTLIVFTSDHGEGFLEHETLKHGYQLYEEFVRVPLVVVGPGIEPGRVTGALVQHVDLAPTVLELAGLAQPAAFQGQSLRPLLAGEPMPDRTAFLDSSWREIDRCAVRSAEWKLILFDDLGRRELYRLTDDPGEQVDLAAEHAELAGRMADAYRAATRVLPGITPTDALGESDPELDRALRAIGYAQAGDDGAGERDE